MNKDNSTQKLTFGIIGTGKMAETMMAAFKLLPGTIVSAVASSSQERAGQFAKQFGLGKAYGSIEALLADPDIQAVYIANETEAHGKTVMLALKAGKAVLCEKPMGVTETEIQQIQAEVERTGILCMEAMWTLCLPAYRKFLELLQNNAIGAPIQLYADFGYPADITSHPRLFEPSSGSGVLLDRGVYPIALALTTFGTVSGVKSWTKKTEFGVDTHATIELQHQNGCISQISVSIEALLQNRAVVSGTNGSIALEPPVIGAEALKIEYFFSEANQPEYPSGNLTAKLKQALKQCSLLRRIKQYKNSAMSEFHSYSANQYLPLLKHFSELLSTRQRESDIYPLSVSKQVLQIIDQVKKSN